ncbi:GroES-like protein [Lindgomyces ingoldianus]|uniref:GroES-like protein n=1 Tax=Lindgomyces ingoldianus TaxID=673940 RepID=A0ACB6Q7Z3_9PLEO|nr:GroES-like protein [Lindgomyces ingoldianus]KAF2462977.1 GroES-like protein [Lindgomyces ingoldianus]
MAVPTVTDEWVIESVSSPGSPALRLNKSVPVEAIGNDEVLLEIKAVSLNYRDLAIASGGYPLPVKFPLIPTSDGSGVVLAVGASVTSLSVGDAVCVLPAPLHVSGHLTTATHRTLGDGDLSGLLRRHVVLPASWVARFPDYLTFVEASTLGAAGVTAWNILFGSGPRGIRAGDWVLTQGTGATAMFAAGFAVLSGATVVGTTSSDAKAQWLTELGVSKVLNYREDPTWGETARKLSPNGEGVDLVVDVGGSGTLAQSLKAIRYDGTVAVTGFLTGGEGGPGPSLIEVLPRAANVRGILGGSRAQYEEMVGMMKQWKFHPTVDKRVFGFEDAKEAYEYLRAQKHVGKVVIEIRR